MAQDPVFEIGAAGVDTSRIVDEVRASVADKMARGVYTDPRVARAERMNLLALRNDESFLAFYLECLRDSVFVDINDFEIVERRRTFGSLAVGLKRIVWKMLKFYTYRLWSQQNQVNGLLLAAIEGVENKYRDRIKELEDKVAKLSAGK